MMKLKYPQAEMPKCSESAARIIENRTGYPKGLFEKTEEVIRKKTGY